MSDEEAMLRALEELDYIIWRARLDALPTPKKTCRHFSEQALAALRPLLAAREAAVRAEERERCAALEAELKGVTRELNSFVNNQRRTP